MAEEAELTEFSDTTEGNGNVGGEFETGTLDSLPTETTNRGRDSRLNN